MNCFRRLGSAYFAELAGQSLLAVAQEAVGLKWHSRSLRAGSNAFMYGMKVAFKEQCDTRQARSQSVSIEMLNSFFGK